MRARAGEGAFAKHMRWYMHSMIARTCSYCICLFVLAESKHVALAPNLPGWHGWAEFGRLGQRCLSERQNLKCGLSFAYVRKGLLRTTG